MVTRKLRGKTVIERATITGGVEVSDVASLAEHHFGSSIRAGIVTVGSNQTTATVSTTAVKSNSLILLEKITAVASAMHQRTSVSSRVDGVSFAVNLVPALASEATEVAWFIVR